MAEWIARPFQSRAELDRYLNEPRVQCLECGRRFKKLATHLSRGHGMAPDDYREKYGIPYSVGLACPELREAVRDRLIQSGRAEPAMMKELSQRRGRGGRLMKDSPIIKAHTAERVAKGTIAARERILSSGPSEAKRAAARENGRRAAKNQQGEKSPNAKLTQQEADTIRSLPRTLTVRELATRFGVSQSAVQRIRSGATYKGDAGPQPSELDASASSSSGYGPPSHSTSA
jgi:hypothetical protein